MISYKALIIIFLIIVILDKGLTITNLIQVNKNFNKGNAFDYSIEKNPMAKWFFMQYGLWAGTFLFSFISLALMFVAYFALTYLFGYRVALFLIFIIMGLVITNNIYFLLKYSQIIN